MLAYFQLCDDGTIAVRGDVQRADGLYADISLTLPVGKDFGNVPFAALVAARYGTLEIDAETETGRILR